MSDGFEYKVRVDVVGGDQVGAMGHQFKVIGAALETTNTLLRSMQADIRAIGVQSNTSFTGVRASLVQIAEAGQVTNKVLGQIDTNLGKLGSTAQQSMGQAGGAIRAFVNELGLVEKAKGALTKTMDMQSLENGIRFAGGVEGAANLVFVKQTANDLKLPLESAEEGFRTLSGAVMGTSIAADQAKAMFTAVGKASVVMGLTSDQTKGTYLALGQIASKGVVSAEELRGQLGERLPGAMNIAARAMGMTQQALGDMMKKGDLAATVFLPKFAAEMEKTFSAGVPAALGSARAGFNAFQNQILDLQLTFGQKLMPVVGQFLSGYVVPAITFVKNHADGLLHLTGAAIGVYSVYQLVAGGFVVWNGAIAVAAFLTPVLAGEMTLLNAVMALNPVGLVTAGLVAFGAAVVWAWGHLETFRGGIFGLKKLIKAFGTIVYDFAIAPIVSFGEIIVGVFTGNMILVKQGIADSVIALKIMANDYNTVGQQLGTAFQNGWDDGVKGFAAEKVVAPAIKTDAVSRVFAGGATKADAPIKEAAKQKAEGITGGGRQVRNIQISIQKQGIDNVVIHTVNMKESADQLKDVFLRLFVETVNAANQIQ